MDQRAPQTRKRILDAAIQVFAQKGYHDTRVDEIVEVSETSKGSVYFHFPSKQEIFLAIIDKLAKLLDEQLQEVLQQETSRVQRLRRALGICFETFEKHQKLSKVFLVQAVGLGQAFECKRQEIQDRFAAVIQHELEQAVLDGEIPPLDAEVTAHIWMGALYHVLMRWVQTDSPEPARLLPTLQTLFLRGIGLPEAVVLENENAR